MDVNSNKLGNGVLERNKRLVNLMNGIGEMKLGTYKENHIDAFGDAYEFLMTMYASNAGKSGGEFFTPQYVSELLTKLALGNKTDVNKVYDPACGSRVIIMITADSNDGDWLSSPLLENKNMDWCAF
jgi:type I restriction enzyme M protein